MLTSSIFYCFNSTKGLKTLSCVSLEAEPGPCPKAALLFSVCPSFYFASHPFPSRISNCSNLPFGTPGRSWRLESRNGGQKGPTCPVRFHSFEHTDFGVTVRAPSRGVQEPVELGRKYGIIHLDKRTEILKPAEK